MEFDNYGLFQFLKRIKWCIYTYVELAITGQNAYRNITVESIVYGTLSTALYLYLGAEKCEVDLLTSL